MLLDVSRLGIGRVKTKLSQGNANRGRLMCEIVAFIEKHPHIFTPLFGCRQLLPNSEHPMPNLATDLIIYLQELNNQPYITVTGPNA